MFFRKKEEELVAQPINYWEELSFIIVPYIDEDVSKEAIEKRFKKNNMKIIGFAESSEDKPGRIVYKYDNNTYEINFFEEEFELQEIYLYQIKDFTKEDIDKIKQCKKAITLCLEMGENIKMQYKMQLKVAYSLLDNCYGILDESAEKFIHPKRVEMIVNSKYLPSSTELYSIQVISDDQNNIWLHTHGLNRYGIADFEILNSNEENYHFHYNTMTTLAETLINIGPNDDNKYMLGYISERIPLIITLLPWTEGLKYYKGINLGGIEDRKDEHNTNYDIIFTYDGDKSYDDNVVSKLDIYDGYWEEDPIFFLSTEETERMSEVARERFNYVKKYFSQDEKNVIVKIGIKTDLEDSDDYEHMWFELKKINEDNTIEVELLSEPYNVKNIKKGDIKTYNIDQITDWLLYLEGTKYAPDTVYLLD